MSARTSAPRARRLVAAGVIATVLTAGSVGAAAATPTDGAPEQGVTVEPGQDTPVPPVTEEISTGGDTQTDPGAGDTSTDPVSDGDTSTDPVSGGDTSTDPVSGGDTSTDPIPGGDTSTDPVSGGDTSTDPIPGDENPTDPAPGDENPTDPAPGDETPADVEVVAPSAEDGSLELALDETFDVDLDDLVTPGTGEIVAIDLLQWPNALGIDYDVESHVLSLTASVAGTHTVQFQASASTAGAEGQEERSNIGTLTVVVVDDTAEAVKPVISWAQVPGATTTSTTARFSVAVDEGEFTLGYVVDLHPDAQSASPVMVNGSSFEVTGLGLGRHTIRVVVERGEAWSALDYEWIVVPAAAPSAPAAPVLSADAIPAQVIRAGIRRGASGESVAIIQRVVGAGVDGRFGPATRAAVIAFQRAHGLVPDGIVGPLTWAAIVDVANGGTGVAPVSASSIPAAQVARGISRGASGSSVAVIQRIVGVSPDGRFGPRTQAAVRAWQKAHGLVADGIVGRLTWAAMVAR